MGDIIRAYLFLLKKNIRTFILVNFLVLLVTLMNTTDEGGPLDRASIGVSALMGGMTAAVAATFIIADLYSSRLQMYELMTGYRPSRILLSRAAVFLPATIIAFYIPFALMRIIHDNSPEMQRALFFFFILFVRIVLEMLFLSSLFKQNTIILALAELLIIIPRVMILEIYGSAEIFDRSLLSLTTAGEMILLGQDISSALAVKIVVSSVIACVICYLVGYFVLKKKFSLEVRTTTGM